MHRRAAAHLGLPVLLLVQLPFAMAPSPAAAQDAGTQANADASADPTSASGAYLSAAALQWDLSASAGISVRDDGPDGSWQSLSLSRRIGRGYARATLMRYHGTLLQADVALPSDYVVGTLGAGGNFDNWVVDGWVSYGRQHYGRISTATTGGSGGGSRSSTGAKGSDYYAIGGDFGRVLPLGDAFYLTPTIAGSFAKGRLLRPAPTGSGLIDLETDEPTWTASAAVRIDRAFGPAGTHYAGLSLSRNWTSNGVSALRLRPGVGGPSLDSRHYADGWSELGANASMALGARLHLDLFATRSIGMEAGNVSAAGAALRASF